MKWFTALILAYLCLPVLAANYYVSPSGDDSASGAVGSPWATFGKAASVITAGDILIIRGGIYSERLILDGKSGTAQSPIIIENFANENVIIDGGSLTVPAAVGRAGLVVIKNCHHIQLRNITVRNFKTTDANAVPVGIQIEGQGTGLSVIGCTVTEIWQSSTNTSANGFGISVYGTSLSAPIEGLRLEGNTVHNLRTGQSESVVLNGNVTGFTVTKNHIYNCNNIGLDFIGYEGSVSNITLDRARNGVCSENHVHGIDSAFNPGYGGNFTTGGGDGSAAGIYVDGGHDILIERNHVHECNFGIELASEHASGFTEDIILRNNLIHHNLSAGIIMGGYDQNRGVTRNCKVLNNTIYHNDTKNEYSGEITFQYYLQNNTFKNNIVWANPVTKHAIVHYVTGGTAVQKKFDVITNIFDYNFYYLTGNAADLTFGLNLTGSNNASFESLAQWRTALGGTAVGDGLNSLFTDPDFATPLPSAAPSPADFKLLSTSECIDSGEPSPIYTTAVGEKDFYGSSRVASGQIDAGCFEYMTAAQTWRDTHFSLPDGDGTAVNLADDEDDPDGDGHNNLLEYSQGMNPNIRDTELAPQGSIPDANGTIYRFVYRKEAANLSYRILTATDDLSDWNSSTAVEQTDSSGAYWRDVLINNYTRFFIRLEVAPLTP